MPNIPVALIHTVRCPKCSRPLMATRWNMPYCAYCKVFDSSRDVRKLPKPGEIVMVYTTPYSALTQEQKDAAWRSYWRFVRIVSVIIAALVG